MTRVADRVCAACPEAIVDFDITEGGRTVGLQFLASGKYFLINNGPYNHDYNMPVPADGNVNLFFYPGPARAWICRSPLTYDKWIPSVLFLTHYLPDDRYLKHGWSGPHEVTDAESQWVNLASLILGQNGIWGDLLAVTDAGIRRIGHFLSLYKQICNDITQSALLRTGQVGGSPEVYEKVSTNGYGAVSLFASAPGTYTYVTNATDVSPKHWHNEGVAVALDERGRARITARFETGGAKIVLFGVQQP
jgi:alpha-galactosidase